MKKFMVMAMAVVMGLALTASAQVTVKESTKTVGDTTVEKTTVKDTAAGVKATEKTTETATSTKTEAKIKGENVKMEKKTIDTAAGEAGKAKVHIKKGELKDFSVDWVYYQEGNDYIVEYTVKDKADKELLAELGLNAEQADAVKAGKHTIVSTSPYTAADIQADFRTLVVKDLKSAIAKKTK